MTWKRDGYSGRQALRFVYDPKVSAGDTASLKDALQHLREMADPIPWIAAQDDFDNQLQTDGKISPDTRAHRRDRWRLLRDALRAEAA